MPVPSSQADPAGQLVPGQKQPSDRGPAPFPQPASGRCTEPPLAGLSHPPSPGARYDRRDRRRHAITVTHGNRGKNACSASPLADRRIFTCVGFMAGSVVCVQIARLWRARGLACLRIVRCEHVRQEDPSGTAGRPGSSPPAPATHSPRALTTRLQEPASGASLFRKPDPVAVPTTRLLPAPGSTSAISRRSPAATSAPGLPKVLSTVVSRRYDGTHRTPRSSSSPAIRRPAGPGPPPAAAIANTRPLT